MHEAAQEELLEKQAYTSDLEEAKDDEGKLAEVYKHHFATVGGTYLADCAVALKGNHPSPSSPGRCLFPRVDGADVATTFWVASCLVLTRLISPRRIPSRAIAPLNYRPRQANRCHQSQAPSALRH